MSQPFSHVFLSVSVTPFLLGNELFFPPGMFVPPLFHSSYPRYFQLNVILNIKYIYFIHVACVIFDRAMRYGVTGFLVAKDILHLILPDSKKTEMKPTSRLWKYIFAPWIPVGVVSSYSATVQVVGGCVWTHYLAVRGGEERSGTLSLSAVQLQEVWLQYSALQIALQVSIHLQTMPPMWSILIYSCSTFPQAYNQSLKTNPSDTAISGLSYFHLFLRAFSQVPPIYYNVSIYKPKTTISEGWK